MDTSPEYILQCEKAEEIQSIAPDAEDSKEWFACSKCKAITLDGYYTNCPHEEKLVWLPRQDQLQEMIINSWSEDERESSNINVVLLDDFQDWVINDCSGLGWSYGGQKVSMEQLWLAFVMKEKYSKVWTGEVWEPIKVGVT